VTDDTQERPSVLAQFSQASAGYKAKYIGSPTHENLGRCLLQAARRDPHQNAQKGKIRHHDIAIPSPSSTKLNNRTRTYALS
jgi:hypothetical protein